MEAKESKQLVLSGEIMESFAKTLAVVVCVSMVTCRQGVETAKWELTKSSLPPPCHSEILRGFKNRI